jgi:hypothetical protein
MQTVIIHTDNYADTPVEIFFTAVNKIPTAVTATAPANITYGGTLGDPSAVAAEGGTSFTYSYSGTLADGGSTAYGPTDVKPTLPGSYTVTATLDSATHTGSGTSAVFTIGKKDLSWVAGTADDRPYNGGINATVSTEPTFSGVINSDNVTVGTGAAYFASATVGTGIAVTGTGYGVDGTDAWKYAVVVQPGFGTANITAKEVTITPDAGQSKKFGAADPAFTFVADPVLYVPDLFSGALTRVEGADVGNYGFNLGTLSAGSNYSLTLDGSATFEITKADAITLPNQNVSHKYTLTGTQTISVAAVMPDDAGTLHYGTGAVGGTTALISTWSVDYDSGLVNYALAGGAVGQSVTLPVTITSTNYETSTVNVVITLTAKDVPTVSAEDITVTYTGSAILDSAITGTASFGGGSVAGTWSFDGSAPINVSDSGTVIVVFTPTDSVNYETVSDTITVTINRATPTGTPTYTAITAAGKTLADAALAIGSITPTGTIQWDSGDSTAVTANTAYAWTFTPADTVNYTTLTGSVTPYTVSGGGGGIGGGGSTPPETTETPVIPTTDVTVTTPKGSDPVVGEDGTITLPGGGTAEVGGAEIDLPKGTAIATDGTITIGSGTAEVTTPDGTEITLPGGSTIAPDGKVTVGSGGATVVTSGGFAFTIEEDSVIIFDDDTPLGFFVEFDNPFTDVKSGDWFYDDVAFVYGYGLFKGTSATTFSPNLPMTRAMWITVLARLDGQDTDGGATWYEKALAWGVAQGITDGTNPDGNITREQLITILYRYVGSPPTAGTLAAFPDAEAVSDYAKDALAWAISVGIIKGDDKGNLNPQGYATRAEVAAILHRFIGS